MCTISNSSLLCSFVSILQVPLCGYGGVSRLEVGGVGPSPSTGAPEGPKEEGGSGQSSCLDIGEVKAGRGIKFNVLLYNSGPRAAFVRATCCGLDSHAPLPDTHAHLVPSRVVILPHSTQELPLFYRPGRAEEEKCRVGKSPVARLVLQSGDELMRQRLVWAIRKGVEEGAGDGAESRTLLTPTSREFVKEFTQRSKTASGTSVPLCSSGSDPLRKGQPPNKGHTSPIAVQWNP